MGKPGPAAERRRWQNTVNQAQGRHFERLLDDACEYYRAKGLADIEKTPEPLHPIQSLGGGYFKACYTAKGQNDYKGCILGGRAIYIEAKHTGTGKLEQDRVTEAQAQRLERAQRMGAMAYVVCSFGAAGFARVPWTVWRDMKRVFGHKYIAAAEARAYEIKIGGPGVLLFLEGIEREARDGQQD